MFTIKKTVFRTAVAAMIVAVTSPAIISSMASAASLSAVTVRFDRMKISTPTTGTVCAKPTSATAVAFAKVTFPTGYTLGTFGTFTVSTTNLAWPSGAVAWTGITTATSVTGQSVIFPSGSLTPATLYCFNWTSPTAVQVSASATSNNSGAVETQATGNATIDTAFFSTASIADDQIVVTASVPQAFSFALSGNTDPLGALSSASVSSSPTPRTVTINTNAASGWNVWAQDSNVGLKSVTANNKVIASTTPGTNSTLAAGTEGYNTGVTSTNGGGSGVITVAAPFVGGATGKGGGLTTAFSSLATSSGTATNHVLSLTTNAAVAGATPAATDYTDTLTVVGAATF